MKSIKLYNDFSMNHEHLLDSPIFSHMLRYNTQPYAFEKGIEISSIYNIVDVKAREHLIES